MILTFKYRIKDATVGKYLDRHSRSVNFVWNYCCETQRKVEAYYKAGAPKRRWPSHFDLVKLTTGCAAELGLHSDTVGQICKQFVISRNAARHAPRFRASGGAKRALGWLPFIKRSVKLDGAHVVYLKRKFHFWKSRDIPDAIKKTMKLNFVDSMDQVLKIALEREIVALPMPASAPVVVEKPVEELAH